MFLLSFPLSLPFDWTLSMCLLFCFVIFWMLCCVMCEKNKIKKLLITKKIISCLIVFLFMFCHGAHSREEQGHADEDINLNYRL